MKIQLATKLGAIAIAVVTSLLTAAPSMSVDCSCRKPERGDKTRGGGNEMIVVPLDKTYRDLHGTVQLNDESIENALVEIFDNADYLLQSGPHEHLHQRRLAACVTGPDGKFCFRHLPAGTYELRSSVKDGWNLTHVHVTVSKRSGVDEEIAVPMSLGT